MDLHCKIIIRSQMGLYIEDGITLRVKYLLNDYEVS
jgi:hypothetical protein